MTSNPPPNGFCIEQLEHRRLCSANPVVFIGDVVVNETNGQTAATFTVELSSAAKRPMQVQYATKDGTATAADNDYQPTSGTLKFAAGERAKTITVIVNGDATQETNETFWVELFNPRRMTIGDSEAVGSIVDGDTPPPPPPSEEPPSPNEEPVYYDYGYSYGGYGWDYYYFYGSYYY